MKYLRLVLTLATVLATIPSAVSAQQAQPTATRTLQLSAFGGLSGVYTGLAGGKNLSITAAGDLSLPAYRGMRPTVEVRGTYPVYDGTIDHQRSILAGLRVDFLLNHRLHPYSDFLLGRGEMDYNHGYVFGNEDFLLTTTNVFSPGAGFTYDLTRQLSLRLDAQFQRWGEAPTESGSVYSTVGTAGIVYRFNFDRRHKH